MIDPVLIVVHPGSACGSADFHMGRSLADDCRQLLIKRLDAWQSHVVILDGELSDELTDYPAFNEALDNVMRRASDMGKFTERRLADDPDQVQVAQRIFGAKQWESTVVRKSTKTYQKVFETFLTVFAVGCSGLLNSKNHCFPTPSVLPMFHAFDFPHHD
jgi:hypothetical protein